MLRTLPDFIPEGEQHKFPQLNATFRDWIPAPVVEVIQEIVEDGQGVVSDVEDIVEKVEDVVEVVKTGKPKK